MKRNKLFSASITLLLIAFFSTSWMSQAQAQKPKPVSITVVAHLNANAMVYHCIWTLTDDEGTFILHEQCEMGSTPVKGRWEIVSGTGKYSNLRGNGSALMPYVGDDNIYEEDLTGVIFK